MALPALLVCTATNCFGAARLPRALARAGFEVTLLAPQGSLAETSHFVFRTVPLPDHANPAPWLLALAASAKATSPRLVVAGDDTALRLLQRAVLSPQELLQPELGPPLAALVAESLGAPAYYGTSIDKLLLPPAAKALGVRVLPDATAAEHIGGTIKRYPAAAWQGTLLAGYAEMPLTADAEAGTPPRVNRCYRDPVLRDLASKLARGFAISGFFSPEFLIDKRTDQPYLLEIHRSIAAGAHCGGAVGVDHWKALHAALQGTAPTTRPDLDAGEEHLVVNFPQEWLRDRASHWLREYPVDVPWDDPELIEAMLAL